jgi:anthranilate synthase/aminodeoxychorismate synthase-like glutamine amidotransferase
VLLMIDNYDSFTYNLVQYLQSLGAEVRVERNDALSVDEIERLAPQRIVISPGPCTPNEAGVSMGVIERLGATTPILGVCLGHQSMGQVYGGDVIRAGASCMARPRASAMKARACSPACRTATRPRATTRWWSTRRRCPIASGNHCLDRQRGRVDGGDHGPAPP